MICHVISQSELQLTLQASESSAVAAKDALTDKELELRELKSQKAAEQGLISKEDHEALRLSMQAEINATTARLNDLTRKHEKTCTEVSGLLLLPSAVISNVIVRIRAVTSAPSEPWSVNASYSAPT